MNSVAKSAVKRFRYIYDFGDHWDHVVIVEKVETMDSTLAMARHPTCVAGKRACPPEDSGGPWGYAETMAILADPKHPEYAERRDWLDEDFNSEAFDIVETNARLAGLFG